MKPDLQFKGRVDDGKLGVADKEKFLTHLRSLKGDVWVSVTPIRKNRSKKLNNYYWGVYIPILADHLGYDHDGMHNALRYMFLLDQSKRFPTLRSTATMTSADFMAYLQQIDIFAAEYGITIPTPDEQYQIKT